MLKIKRFAAGLAMLLASCTASAIDYVGGDGKTFRFTDEEVEFCKANGGCTVVSNDEVAKVSQLLLMLQQALEEAKKRLQAAESKRCI